MVIAVLLLAAFAMPGEASSPPQGRRPLSENPLDSAAEVLNSPPAAKEAGAAAGNAVKEFAEFITSSLNSTLLNPAATPATNSSDARSVQEVRTTLCCSVSRSCI